MNLNNKHLWMVTKVFSVLFNSFSTWTVFHEALSKSIHSGFLNFLGSMCAVILIDVLFVALINRLEAERSEEEVFEVRWAYVIGLITLYAAIVVIGLMDEGVLAIAPRVGLGILTLIAVLQFLFQYRSYADAHWQERFEAKKNRMEREDQQNLLRQLRQIKNKQQRIALQEITDELKYEYMEKHRRQLLTLTGQQPEDQRKPDPPVVESRAVIHAVSNNGHSKKLLTDPLRKGIEPTDDGRYSWICEYCNMSGIADTLQGAKIAQSRHTNQHVINYEN